MLIDAPINDLDLELQEPEDWIAAMRILHSHRVEIDNSVYERAQRYIRIPDLNSKRATRAVKNLCVNGGRGVFHFKNSDVQMEVALQYAKISGLKSVMIISKFNRFSRWLRVIGEMFDTKVNVVHGASVNIPKDHSSSFEWTSDFQEGFEFYLCDHLATTRQVRDHLDIQFLVHDTNESIPVFSREMFPILSLQRKLLDLQFLRYFVWTEDQEIMLSEFPILKHYATSHINLKVPDKIDKEDFHYLLKKTRITI